MQIQLKGNLGHRPIPVNDQVRGFDPILVQPRSCSDRKRSTQLRFPISSGHLR
jgi:hypothetical protein